MTLYRPRRKRNADGRHHRDLLAVECWCQHNIIHIPAQLIRAGKTATCGRPRCTPP